MHFCQTKGKNLVTAMFCQNRTLTNVLWWTDSTGVFDQCLGGGNVDSGATVEEQMEGA